MAVEWLKPRRIIDIRADAEPAVLIAESDNPVIATMTDLEQSVGGLSLDYDTYALGDFSLKNGGIIPDAKIAYKTFGKPSNPAVIYPTWYSGLISDNEWLIGADKTLDPEKYFIVITALFGNGQSSSPSNRKEIRPWPEVLFFDNVKAQYELVTKKLRITHARAVLGWSMGAGQTYQWATQYPDFMDLVIPFCGSAKTALHNQSMLEGVKVAVLSGKGATSGGVCRGEANAHQYRAWSESEKSVGLKALGRTYSGWGFSQAFYREKLFQSVLGFKDIEDFMVNFWEAWALSKGPWHVIVWANGNADDTRSGQYDRYAVYMASRGLLSTRTV